MRPLEGVRILDLSQAYAGPFCTMNLADHGAEVIKIERPGAGDQVRTWGPMKDGESGFHACLNRNKYGITLDLKTEEGKEVFRRLLKTADVVCENYKVGVLEKLGFSYEAMREINPRIIYANITGFGLQGPLAQRPCYDIVAQAMGGMMDVTGFAGGLPTKVGPAIADNYTGELLAIGILMALYKRERTGEGGHVDVAMVDTMIHILDHLIIDYTILGEKHSRSGNNDQSIAPFDSFAAKDGMFVLACGTDGMFAKLCGLMERPDLLEDARYATNYDRCCNYAALKPEIERWSTTRTVDELEEAILAIGIPFGRIQDVEQVVKNPQTTARNMLWDVDQPGMGRITITGTPIKISYEEDKLIKAAPVMGEDNARILETLGYTPQDLAALSKKGVI